MVKVQGKDSSVVLNAIHKTASSAYQSAVPLATAKNITDVGAAVLAAPSAIRNEFMQNLYNKIGLTLIDSPVVENQFSFLRKGTLEYGQVIEDLYIGLAESEPYVTGMSDGDYPDPFAIRKLPHFSAFYSTILSRQYHVTRHQTDLRKAFHTGGGVEQFVAGMMNSMVSKENYDDMRMTIALVARQVEESLKAENHNGTVHLLTEFNANRPVEEQVTAEDALQSRDFLQFFSNSLKKWSKRLRWLRNDLNIAGVDNNMPLDSQRIMMIQDITTDFETELLAWAFNSNHLQLDRIDEIDTWYSIGATKTESVIYPEDIKVKTTFSDAEGGSTMCLGVIYDANMLQIWNKERIASDQANGKGNYWNMFMSVEDIYAASPYKNMISFMLD